MFQKLVNPSLNKQSHQNGRSPVQQGTISDVGVTCDPTNVCCAKVDVSWMVVKRVLEGSSSVEHIAPNGVQHSLGLPCAATGQEKMLNKL